MGKNHTILVVPVSFSNVLSYLIKTIVVPQNLGEPPPEKISNRKSRKITSGLEISQIRPYHRIPWQKIGKIDPLHVSIG